MMKKITHNHIIFSSTLLYFVGIYVSDTIPYGKTMIVFALGMMLVSLYIRYGTKIPKQRRYNGYLLYIFSFLIYCALSMIWAKDPSLTVSKIFALLFIFIAMFIINLSYGDGSSFDPVLEVIMYGGHAIAVYIIIRYGWSGVVHLITSNTRISNDLINANTIGMCAAYSLVINIYFVIYYGLKLRDILVFPTGIVLIVSQSRKAVIIVIVGIIGIYFLKHFSKRNFRISITKFLIGAIIISVLLIFISRLSFMAEIMSRFADILDMISGKGTRETNTAWLRFAYNDLGLQLFRQSPLIGIGIGNANLYTQILFGNNHYLHNNYVELLACGGLIGFFLYYSIHLYILFFLWKYRKYRDKEFDICLVLLLINLIVDYGAVSYYDKGRYLFLYLYWLKTISLTEIREERKIEILSSYLCEQKHCK
ncbi:MAG: O-antigen ligase family protein [Saccharofermentanales bacterium]|jgi:O-antigen ligase|nr:O-antigen ligase family protein [Bacillota bacterium]